MIHEHIRYDVGVHLHLPYLSIHRWSNTLHSIEEQRRAPRWRAFIIKMMVMKILCPLILLLTGLLALVTCPHSKVEESFNLQATHDLFYHGIGPAWRSTISCVGDDESCDNFDAILYYDHLQFPGVVPRTFTGAFVLSWIARIIAFIIPKRIFDLPSHPMAVQFLIRLELLLLSWLAHIRLASSLKRHFLNKSQSTTAQIIFGYYLLITASQFHIPFYSSRLLPNTFALLLTTLAYAEWFNGCAHRTAIILVFTTAIFRCDVLLLLFTVGLTMLIRRDLGIVQAFFIGIVTGISSVLITAPIDSLLWQRIVWPELEVWWFNTVDNRSSEWGTMPFHWYISNALPKGLLLTSLLIPLAFLNMRGWITAKKTNKQKISNNTGTIDYTLLQFFIPTLGFVILYSFLPHKEIRFIFPSLPIFNACAAYGLSKMHIMAHSTGKGSVASFLVKALYCGGLMTVIVTMIGSMLFLRLSMENYPGGAALQSLKNHFDAIVDAEMQQSAPEWEDVHVHVDVAAAMTGVSLYGQRSVTQTYPIQFSKSGYEAANSLKDPPISFSHLLSEKQTVASYQLVDAIDGYPTLDKRNLQISTKPAVYVLERHGWHPKITKHQHHTHRTRWHWYFIAATSIALMIVSTLAWQAFTGRKKSHVL